MVHPHDAERLHAVTSIDGNDGISLRVCQEIIVDG